MQSTFKYIKKYHLPIINFNKKNISIQGLIVQIQTKRLFLRSVSQQDINNLHQYLYSQKDVMKLFGLGQTKTLKHVSDLIKRHAQRWRTNDPYSGLVIENKITKQFIGYIVLGYGDQNGSSEMALLIRKDKWSRGYGEQAGGAVVLFYSEELKKQNYRIQKCEFQKIVLMCHCQNFKSIKMFKKLNAQQLQSQIRYNALRYLFDYRVGNYSKQMFV